MKEYTTKQLKQLGANPYVYKATKHRTYYTAKFKEDFWISYQAGNTPRKILENFGFDLSIFGQKQIDSLVQHIKSKHYQGKYFQKVQTEEKESHKNLQTKKICHHHNQ